MAPSLKSSARAIPDEYDLDRDLGHGASLLRDAAASPVGADAWQGSPRLFQALVNSNPLLPKKALTAFPREAA